MPVLVGTSPVAGEDFPTDAGTLGFLGNSGIVLSDGSIADEYGCTWKWNPTNAWGSKPAPKEKTGDRDYDHGQWDATDKYGARIQPIPGTVRAPSHAALHLARQRLNDAVTVEYFMLRVVEPGFDGYAMVRQQGELLWTEDGTPNTPHATFSIGLYAGDPLIYSMRERTFEFAFPSVTGGATWPKTWPAIWNASVVSGSEILLNPGSEPVGIQFRVDGPVGTAQIAFPDTGEALYLENPDGPVLLTAGQWLDIDTTTRQVLLNGEASRRSWVHGNFLLLQPGVETLLAVAGTGVTGASGISGAYRAVRI